MKTAAVMVAAGMSSRMKSFKPLLQLAGSTVIRTAITTLKSAGVTQIVVVTGKNAERLERHVEDPIVTCIYNERYATSDMFYSARMGLSHIHGKADRTFFLPADAPLFSKQSLFTMMGFMDYSHCHVLIPCYKGERGHPVLIKDDAIPEITSFRGDYGLRGALENYGGHKDFIELPDLGTTLDADKPEDYELLKKYARTMALKEPMTCGCKVVLSRTNPFFDDDVAYLLEQVAGTFSISDACASMGISYTKGWKSIKIAESQLGFPLVTSYQGGVGGGGSSITPHARALLTVYKTFRERVDRFLETEFQKYFSDYQEKEEGDVNP